MKFCLGRGLIGPWPYIPISADEFNGIKAAKDNLYTILGVEEKFDMILQNYAEYEETLLSLALGRTISRPLDREASFLVNRRLSNLLTTCRQYTDQFRHDFISVYGRRSTIQTQVAAAFGQQYDLLLGYRVMEAIRNYAQHRAFPVTRLCYPIEREDRGEGHLILFRVRAELNVDRVIRDGCFKANVAQELKSLKQPFVDITGMVRQYVQGLGCAHTILRELTKADIESWGNTILGTLDRYAKEISEVPTLVAAYRLTDEDDRQEDIDIFRDGVDRLQDLRQRRPPNHLTSCYVSNELVRRASA